MSLNNYVTYLWPENSSLLFILSHNREIYQICFFCYKLSFHRLYISKVLFQTDSYWPTDTIAPVLLCVHRLSPTDFLLSACCCFCQNSGSGFDPQFFPWPRDLVPLSHPSQLWGSHISSPCTSHLGQLCVLEQCSNSLLLTPQWICCTLTRAAANNAF